MNPCRLALTIALAAAPLAAAHAQGVDPAALTVKGFDDGLLSVMKDAKSLGAKGRYKRLQPVVERTFDIPVMTRFAVGASWSAMSASDQAILSTAFGKLTAATYARNFDSYSGETISVDPKVETRGPDKLVRTTLKPSSGAPVLINYRMRQAMDGTWKVIDVYYNGSISGLAGQRSEFAAPLAAGGAPALRKKLDQQISDLLK